MNFRARNIDSLHLNRKKRQKVNQPKMLIFRGAIMFPSYEGYRPNLELAEDDILGIQALYGPPKVSVS